MDESKAAGNKLAVTFVGEEDRRIGNNILKP